MDRRCVAFVLLAVACSGDPAPPGPDAADLRDDGPAADEGPAPDDGPATPPPPTMTPGAPDRLLLVGTVLTPTEAFAGQVLVDGAILACVRPGVECGALPAAEGATVIETHGVIAPGLIDAHNHILFDIFDDSDWLPERLYVNHDEWPKEARYAAMLDVKQCLEDASQGKPAWCPEEWDGTGNHFRCEMDKWGELKGMVAGTTSIVGLPGTSAACFGSLSRSIDVTQNDVGRDCIQTSALFPTSKTSVDGVCDNFLEGACGEVLRGKTQAYLVHCGEGLDEAARAEFDRLGAMTTQEGCLYNERTVITHGTAFGPAEFAVMAQHGMKLAWSPASNVALYGATTDIPAARAAGVRVSMGPDWSMGGSQNLLDELRFADAWDDGHWGNVLDARALVDMVTVNAAKSLALDDVIGSLGEGMLADLAVFTPAGATAWDAVLAATPATVRLVVVGGRVLYGDAALKAAGPALPGCEDLEVCGAARFVCAAETTAEDKLDQTASQVRDRLESALQAVDALTPDDGWNFAPLSPLVTCSL